MFEMLLGHCVGDYILQNKWMALNKGKYSWLGHLSCSIHCAIYTLAVCTLMQNFDRNWICLVFTSHYILDKFGFTELWLQVINGRSLYRFLEENKNKTLGAMEALQAGFATLVYAVVDNTMHLLYMYYGYKMLYS